ncbi:lipoma HMGIC fusion partner-like [Limulus polyphemus]|uniref:Lipoma HMGIC fusion partner-like n=1 Tax=Limulus polyphemus TaxID=6850 RepID=A0ABM1BHP0_LIMPO|nr:lipoma HMGIC fusion partner-like [Limulus polyphemus]
MPVLASSMTATGVFWACLSLASAILNCAGFYLPFWLQGVLFNSTEVSFGSFRRCSYPQMKEDGEVQIVRECGRYTTFQDIPSISWQITTITVGVGAATSLLVAFTALAACCVTDVVTKRTARALGLVQVLTAIMIVVGGAIYPNGWGTREVREVCGGISDSYYLGACQLSWSFYLMGAGVTMLFLCAILSLGASRIKPHSYRI